MIFDYGHFGDIQNLFQTRCISAQYSELVALNPDFYFCFQSFSDAFFLTSFFELHHSGIAEAKNLFPFFQQRRGIFGEDRRRGRELRQMNGSLAALDSGQMLPDFISRETQDGRDQADEGFRDLPQHGP